MLRVSDDGVTTTSMTVTIAESENPVPLATAVMVAVPPATAVTRPLVAFTVATEVLLELHAKAVSRTSVDVAASATVPPLITFAVGGVTDTVTVVTVEVSEAPVLFPTAVMTADPTPIPVTDPVESTVAMAVLLDDHIKAVSNTLVEVAVKGVDVPVCNLNEVGVRVTSFTVTSTESDAPLDVPVAVTVAVPPLRPVTFPEVSTVATAILLEVQINVLSPFEAAAKLCVTPLLRVSDEGVTTTSITDIVAVSDAPLVVPVAVMVAVPPPTPVTFPDASTVATAVSLDIQVNVLSPFEVAARACVASLLRVSDEGVTITSITVTAAVAEEPVVAPVAVTVAVPPLRPVTFPDASTVATAILLEVQVNVLSPFEVAARACVASLLRVSDEGVTITSITVTFVVPETRVTLPVAVMVVVPWAIEVTMPLASTVATDVSLEVQVNAISDGSVDIAVSRTVSPRRTFGSMGVTPMVTIVTCTVSTKPLLVAVAVMVAVPAAKPVTRPVVGLTPTRVGLSDVHVAPSLGSFPVVVS